MRAICSRASVGSSPYSWHRMPSTNMFLPLRGSATSSLQRSSSGTSCTSKPSLRSAATVSTYDATTAGSRWLFHMLSSRIFAPGLSSPARTRPIRTCSLKATTSSVWSPPLVTRSEPIRIRIPLAPATLRAGGWISAGMISVVQMPLPIRAAIAPSDWPQRCAPSPESLMTSTIASRIAVRAARALATGGSSITVSFMVSLRCSCSRRCSGEMDAGEVVLLARQAEGRVLGFAALAPVDAAAVAQAEVGLHGARGLAARAHRLDHRRRAGDDVAAGVDAGDRGGEVRVGGDVAALVELQARGLAEDRIGIGPDREDDRVGLELERAAGHRQRAPASGGVGLAELHLLAAHRAHVAAGVADQLERAGQPVELDAFLHRVMDLLDARRRLGGAAPVDAVHLLGADAKRDAHRVHRGVAGADDGDAPAGLQRRVVAREVTAVHQVAARQPFVRREDAIERLAGDPHEARVARAGADEDGVKAHLAEHLLEGEQAPDERVALEPDAEARELPDLDVDDAVGQAEVGDAVLQDAAGLVERLVHEDLAAGLGHVGGARHSRRPRADDADLEPARLDVGNIGPAFLDRHVADEALEAADRLRLERFADHAHALALALLRADSPAHRRQQVGVGDRVVGAVEILGRHLADEARDIDADRAAPDARLGGAVEAAVGLDERGFLGRLVAAEERHEVVEVDQVAVEVGPVDASEPDLLADLDAAPAAHAGAVDHHLVQAHHRADAVRARRLGAALHHDRRADGDDLVDVGVLRDRLADALGDESLDSRPAVVRADDHLVAAGAELVCPEDKRLAAKTDDADHVGAALVIRARLRKDGRDAEAAADADGLLRLAEVARDSHWTDDRVQPGAGAAALLHLARRLADRLDDEGDRAALAIEIGDRQRDALAARMLHHDHELARMRCPGHRRMGDLEQVRDFGEVFALQDLEVGHCNL